jgi:hypothetical protein
MNILRFILRTWSRNKLFFLISIVSLTVGLTCTNLLFTFFVHEYGIETGNPDRSRLYVLQQDSPMRDREHVAYAQADIPPQLKERYAEVADYFRCHSLAADYCKYGDRIFKHQIMLCADTTLLHFFDYTAVTGSLHEALTVPGKVAVSETYARRVFGNADPIGERLLLGDGYNGDQDRTYQVCAVVKERPQSLLHFDLLAGLHPSFFGGLALLKLNPGADPQALAEKINRDKIPTLLPGSTQYHVFPLSRLYFVTPDNGNTFEYVQQSNLQLLYIYLIAALLILFIACFNYSNLTLSRTLQQLKTIHVERLMGGSSREIRLRLFADAFLLVLMAFAASLLLIHDLLPLFNRLMNTRLQFGFFFSGQMMAYLMLFLLLLSVVPALYISRKLSRITLSAYNTAYTGRRKRRIVSLLVVLQFVISIMLLFAAFTAEGQMRLVRHGAAMYKDKISVGDPQRPDIIRLLKHELEKSPAGIRSMTIAETTVISSYLRYYGAQQADGTESRSYILEQVADTTLLTTMDGIRLLQGDRPDRLMQRYPRPALVNQTYVRRLIPPGVSPVGHLLREYDAEADSAYVIGGIVQDFTVNSLEEPVAPSIIYFRTEEEQGKHATSLLISLVPEQRDATIRQIARVWERIYPEKMFSWLDMYETVLSYNTKITTLTRLLTTYSVIGLLLIALGLFGISWYATRQRIREIGIRKIHGASTRQILLLLWKPFAAQLAAAYLIAIPIAYLLMQHWREQFANRAPWSIATFVLPLVIVGAISLLTLSLHSVLAAQTNPGETIKQENADDNLR